MERQRKVLLYTEVNAAYFFGVL